MGKSVNLNKNISFSAKTVYAINSSNDYYNVGDYLMSLFNDSTILMDILYPIGSIFITNNSNNLPKISGVWTRWGQGRAIVGVDSNSSANTTGGEYNHKLTIDEMPSHTHGLTHRNKPNSSGSNSWDYGAGNSESGRFTTSTGGESSHNNIQPSVAYYCYRRTS